MKNKNLKKFFAIVLSMATVASSVPMYAEDDLEEVFADTVMPRSWIWEENAAESLQWHRVMRILPWC